MTVVLVHGNPETPAVWDLMADRLREQGQGEPVRLAPPGFGAPLPAGFKPTPQTYRDWLTGQLEAIGEHFGDRAEVCGANAGLHVLVWLRGRDGGVIEAVSDKARRVGVGLYSIRPYYLRPPRRSGVLLGYGPLSEREIREGIQQHL